MGSINANAAPLVLIQGAAIIPKGAELWYSRKPGMAKNIEIKAKVRDVASLTESAVKISKNEPEILDQEDIFFPVQRGRLKLRILAADQGELIFYERKNEAGPKTSTYFVSKTSEPALLKTVLESAYGVHNTVRKKRQIFLAGRTRIHLDRVEGLGDFMELEVVLEDGEDETAGRKEAQQLMTELGIQEEDLVDCAYVDLLP